MAADIVMPRLSDSMTEGTIVRWLKREGDQIGVGDALVEIETDKATMVYEADVAGVLFALSGGEGDTLPIGEVLAQVGDPEEAERGAEAGTHPPAPASTPAVDPGPASPSADLPPPARAAAPASPLARRIAADNGLDLEGLRGSGPGGRIVKRDVLGALAAPATDGAAASADGSPAASPDGTAGAKGEVTVEEPSRLQQTVARRMSVSRATVPHFEVGAVTDMSGVLDLRRRLKEVAGPESPAPSVNDFILKACALALREQPRANSAWIDSHVELYSRVNVGMAVAAEGSLLVPTVFDADRKSLGEIARATRALAERARDGSITPPELAGGTFTVSNLGMFGIDFFDAVINPPQAAILAVGAVAPRVHADAEGETTVRPTATLTLACDHRVLYGADAARLLARIRDLLQEPLGLAL
jgi:pyruvate dehydrogenase E2 component (dihydrolipoamide acetyltransferase)